jgi:hypothetical protein
MGLMAAWERPSTYWISLSKAGYLDLTINNVVVTTGDCQVNTVTVDATLNTI